MAPSINNTDRLKFINYTTNGINTLCDTQTNCSQTVVHETDSQQKSTIKIGVVIPWTGGWRVGHLIGSAVLLGFEEVEKRNILPAYKVEWTWEDSFCNARLGLKKAVQMYSYYQQQLDGYVGRYSLLCCYNCHVDEIKQIL